MMITKEEIVQTVQSLSKTELEQLAQYLAFIKYQSRIKPNPPFDENELSVLYREFGTEDRELAEERIPDYAGALSQEDAG